VLRALVGIGVGTTTGLTAPRWIGERHALTIVQTEVPLAALPRSLDGLRVGVLTDIHRSAMVSRDHVERAVDLLNAEAPDVILLGGDYVSYGDRTYVESVVEALARLAAPHGVFAVLGNHDEGTALPEVLARRGIALLADARAALTIRGTTMDVIGLRFWTRDLARIRALRGAERRFRLLLAHDPRRVTEASALRIPLVVSGHTHGGQVVLPVLGAVAARRFPVVAGLVRDHGGSMVYVSRGVGTVYVPVRANCPPEVTVLTLQHQDVITE
jgi:predicted MPP superfamily phosphohydrolase